MKMPVLFIGHGSPMNIILKNSFTEKLTELSKNLQEPKSILVISAHWLTAKKSKVCCVNKPETIHDFYGFPEELYRIKYPCPGFPALAKKIEKTITNPQIICDMDWGLDHGAWSILKHIYPGTDIPVLQLSLNYSFNEWNPLPLQYHYNLARQLVFLREEGVLVIGSGNIVHNLSLIDFGNIDSTPFNWAMDFDEKVKTNLINNNHQNLLNLQSMGKSALPSVPTLDHYLPMIYSIALQQPKESIKFIYEGFQNASISMRCFQIG